MTNKQKDQYKEPLDRIAEEESIREKVDQYGIKWTKAYFGGGIHFQNWLNQCIEIKGEENVEVEEVDSRGFQCFEESGEKMYRIWIRDSCVNED